MSGETELRGQGTTKIPDPLARLPCTWGEMESIITNGAQGLLCFLAAKHSLPVVEWIRLILANIPFQSFFFVWFHVQPKSRSDHALFSCETQPTASPCTDPTGVEHGNACRVTCTENQYVGTPFILLCYYSEINSTCMESYRLHEYLCL